MSLTATVSCVFDHSLSLIKGKVNIFRKDKEEHLVYIAIEGQVAVLQIKDVQNK